MLFETEASAKKAVKDAQTALNVETLKAYGDLTVDVVKSGSPGIDVVSVRRCRVRVVRVVGEG